MPNPQPTGNPPTSQYVDPFQFAKVIPERVDMGADFSGTGPIDAIGSGRITEADTSWSNPKYGGNIAPGTFIAEKLDSGPAAGQTFYYAEQINNVRVHVGEHVNAGDHIADFVPGGQTEFGWAEGGKHLGVTMADKTGQYHWDGDPTAFGKSAANFIHSTGVPANSVSGKLSGTVPATWYPQVSGSSTQQATTTSWITSLLGGALGGKGWKDLLERGGLIFLGGALVIVGIILLAGKQSIKIGMAAAAPEATLAQQVKANAVAIRAKGAANSG